MRRGLHRIRVFAVAVLAAGTWGRAAADSPPALDGYKNLKFGMSKADVAQVIELKDCGLRPLIESSPPRGPMTIQGIVGLFGGEKRDRPLEDCSAAAGFELAGRPVDYRLSFYKDRLFVITLRPRLGSFEMDKTGELYAALKDRYGKPTASMERFDDRQDCSFAAWEVAGNGVRVDMCKKYVDISYAHSAVQKEVQSDRQELEKKSRAHDSDKL
jgi:hypothetical protein